MSEGDATSIETFVRSDLFRAILRTQHADLLSASTTAASTVPTGSVVPYAVEGAPDGWLLCNGQDVYKDTYPQLYALLTTKYGTPLDTLKFRLPDMQGRVPVGYGTGYTTLNSPSGASTVALTVGQLPSHTHGINAESPGTSGHSQDHAHSNIHPSGNLAGSVFGYQMINHNNAYGNLGSGGATANHTHTVNSHAHGGATVGAGSNEAHSNMQPYVVLNYIIRT